MNKAILFVGGILLTVVILSGCTEQLTPPANPSGGGSDDLEIVFIESTNTIPEDEIIVAPIASFSLTQEELYGSQYQEKDEWGDYINALQSPACNLARTGADECISVKFLDTKIGEGYPQTIDITLYYFASGVGYDAVETVHGFFNIYIAEYKNSDYTSVTTTYPKIGNEQFIVQRVSEYYEYPWCIGVFRRNNILITLQAPGLCANDYVINNLILVDNKLHN